MKIPLSLNSLWQKPGLVQFVKFCLVGTGAATVDLGLLNFFVLVAGFNVYLSRTFSFIVATMVGYTLNRIWTFRSGRQDVRQYFKFLFVQTVGLALNLGIMYLLIEFIHLWYNFAAVTAILCVTAWTYSASRFWVFKKPS